jgi:hypothetical protein
MSTRGATIQAPEGAARRQTRDAKRERREALLIERQRAEAAARRRQRLLWAGGAGVLLAALVALGWWLFGPSDSRVQTFPIQGQQHIQRGQAHPPYNSIPPTSGWHYGDAVAPPGIHTQPIPDEVQVHNLEHGEIMIQYHCDDGCPQIVSQLEAIVRTYPKKVILAPYPALAQTGRRIALTSWGRLAYLDEVDEPFIRSFIARFKDKAPEYFPD